MAITINPIPSGDGFLHERTAGPPANRQRKFIVSSLVISFHSDIFAKSSPLAPHEERGEESGTEVARKQSIETATSAVSEQPTFERSGLIAKDQSPSVVSIGPSSD